MLRHEKGHERYDLSSSLFIEKLKEGNFVICSNSILLDYRSVSKDAKFCYLHILRYALFSIMAGDVDEDGNPLVFVSKETLAEDLGVSRTTISRYLGELRRAGLVETYLVRGQGKTDVLRIWPPKPWSQKDLQEAAEWSRIKNETSNRIKNETSNRSKFATQKNREVKEEKETLTDPLAGVRETVAEITAQHRERSAQRRKNPRPRKEPPKNCNTLLKEFSKKIELKMNLKPPLITGKERMLAKRLVDHYGYEFASEMFDWVIRDWETFCREKKINGTPNVSLVFGYRDYIAGKVQAGKEAQEPDDDSDW